MPFSTKQRSAKVEKAQDQGSIAKLAVQAQLHGSLSSIYTLSKHHVSTHGFCVSKIPRENEVCENGVGVAFEKGALGLEGS